MFNSKIQKETKFRYNVAEFSSFLYPTISFQINKSDTKESQRNSSSLFITSIQFLTNSFILPDFAYFF